MSILLCDSVSKLYTIVINHWKLTYMYKFHTFHSRKLFEQIESAPTGEK